MEYAIKTLKCEKKFIEETFKDRELAKQKISEIDQALQLLQTDVMRRNCNSFGCVDPDNSGQCIYCGKILDND